MRLIWSRRALDALRSIQEAGDARTPGAGRDMAERILVAVDRIVEFPRIGRPFGTSGARLFVLARTPYLIRYDLRPERLEILDIYHGAREWRGGSP